MVRQNKTPQQVKKPETKKAAKQNHTLPSEFSSVIAQVQVKSTPQIEPPPKTKAVQSDMTPPVGKAPRQDTTSKLCTELKEISTLWDRSVDELLHVACEGELIVGIRDHGAAHLKRLPTGAAPPEDYEGNTEQCRFIGVLTLEMDDLAQLASSGSVRVEVAYLHRLWGTHSVWINPPRTITFDDIVVPQEEVARYGKVVGKQSESPDEPVGEQGRQTYLKQIAGLALVIAHTSTNPATYMHGKKLNYSKIGEAVEKYFNGIAPEALAKLNLDKMQPKTISQNISKGIELIESKKVN